MPYCIILILVFNQADDTLSKPAATEPFRSYNKEIIINGSVGLGFGIGSGVFFLLGNKAYENYKRSGSMKSASEYFNQSVAYDNARNICAVGAVFFLARAFYYQLKSARSGKTAGAGPALDIAMPEYAKLQLGFRRSL
jgi:hypothetical protein